MVNPAFRRYRADAVAAYQFDNVHVIGTDGVVLLNGGVLRNGPFVRQYAANYPTLSPCLVARPPCGDEVAMNKAPSRARQTPFNGREWL